MAKKPGRDVFRIVYYAGDRTKLSVADIWTYEADEYDIASRETFYEHEDAMEHARELANKHGLRLVGDRDDPAYLD